MTAVDCAVAFIGVLIFVIMIFKKTKASSAPIENLSTGNLNGENGSSEQKFRNSC